MIHLIHPKQIGWQWNFINQRKFIGIYVPITNENLFYSLFSFLAIQIVLKRLTSAEVDRIIEMAWEDRTPFDAIDFQFNLKENEVIHLMRSNLKTSSFKMWRKRVTGRKLKHGFPDKMTRFKSANQK